MSLKQNKIPDYDEQRGCAVAIKENDMIELKRFINEYGVNAPVDGGTALHQSIFRNNTEAAQWLLTNKADPDAWYEEKFTPLITALDRSQWELARVLIKNNADVNKKDKLENSPLSKAIFNYDGDLSVIQLLLEKGAQPDQELTPGFTPLDLATRLNQPKVIRLLNKYL